MAMPKLINELPTASLGAGDLLAAKVAGVTSQVTITQLITEAATFTQSGTGAVARTVQERGRLIVYPQDYMSAAQMADVAAFTGSLDVSDAILAAYTALPSSGGIIKFPPGKYKVDFTGADVVSDPIITVDITKDGVFIDGSGDATIIDMTGITIAQLNAGSDDPGDAGTDVATVFNFNDVDGGGVSNIRFTGTGGGTAVTAGKARAKGVGVINSRRIQIFNVTGEDIPGNVINLRGNSGAEATSTSYCSVAHCVADACSESGINFMGGTYRCSLIDSQSHRNQAHGFESGTTHLMCTGNVFVGNQGSGIVQVGNDGVILGNHVEASETNGIVINYDSATFAGARNLVMGNKVRKGAASTSSSAGIITVDNTDDCLIADNLVDGTAEGVKISGTASLRHRVINNTLLSTTSIGINVIGGDGLDISDNYADTSGTNAYAIGAVTNSHVINNRIGSGAWSFSLSATGMRVYGNEVFGTLSPSPLSGDVNDYNIGWSNILRTASATSARTITGFANGVDQREILIINRDASLDIVIGNQHASSADANKVITGTGADLTLSPDEWAKIIYDSATARWRVIGTNGT